MSLPSRPIYATGFYLLSIECRLRKSTRLDSSCMVVDTVSENRFFTFSYIESLSSPLLHLLVLYLVSWSLFSAFNHLWFCSFPPGVITMLPFRMPLLKLKGICLHLYKVKYLVIDEHLNRSYFRTLYWKYTFCLETDSSFHPSHETILFGIIFFGRDLLSTDAPMDAAHIL